MTSSPLPNLDQEVMGHYRHGALLETILAALKSSGKDLAHLLPDDLAPVDEFHTGGREATVNVADQMSLTEGLHLLDVGSGLGGPARYFAGHRRCTVTGIDLSSEYCDTAKELSALTKLDGRTNFHATNAAALPFPTATFDAAYMLHVGMNIPVKAEVFEQVARVLKPGAVFALFDMMRDAPGDLTFPVPWSSVPETSFVETPATYAELLTAAGFTIETQTNRRDFALAFFAKMRAAMQAPREPGAPPPLNLSAIMGPSNAVKLANLSKMIQDGLVSPTEMICRKQ